MGEILRQYAPTNQKKKPQQRHKSNFFILEKERE